MSLELPLLDDFCGCGAEACATMGVAMISFSVAMGFAVGECFGFGVADCSGAAVADGVGVGLSGSETGAGDRCAKSNNKLPNRTKRIMGFISKLNSRSDGAHEVFFRRFGQAQIFECFASTQFDEAAVKQGRRDSSAR